MDALRDDLVGSVTEDIVNIQGYYTSNLNNDNEDHVDDSDDADHDELSDLVAVGFDSEYVSRKSHNEDESNPEDNVVLSLQFYLIAGSRHTQQIVFPNGPDKFDRPSFSSCLLDLINQAIQEGVLLKIPERISFAGFFRRTDLVAFRDFNNFKFHLKNIGGKIGSDPDGVAFSLKHDASPSTSDEAFSDRVGAPKNLYIRPGESAVDDPQIKIRFYDLGSHVAEGTNLAMMGDLIGLPKLKIPEGFSIERMDELLEGDPKSFKQYAMRDAEITAKYFVKLAKFAYENTGNASLPATASSLGVRLFDQSIKAASVDFNKMFGLHREKHVIWNNQRGRPVTLDVAVRDDHHLIHQPFVGMCYHGGRNESFHFGPTEVGIWNDFDLAAAYTTGLVDMKLIDYDNPRISLEATDFIGHVLGFALVEFEFPKEVRYPCLPVEGHNGGLFYPLVGKSYCTAPEIEAALNLNCKIVVKHGVIFPWRDDQGDLRPFEPMVRKVRELRKSYKKGSLDELYAKLLGNGMYGKLAQGIKPKNVFDTRYMQSEKLPCSRVSNALMAAHTTGLIRAVLSELIAGLPPHRRAISATTDGFITDATIEELDLNGPLATRYAELCERVIGHRQLLEMKHRVKQLISSKVRGQFTTIPDYDYPLILAKAGISPPISEPDKNAYMVKLFINRNPNQLTQSKPFTPIRQQWMRGVDVTRSTCNKRMNLEYDHKRRLTNPKVESVVVDGKECKHITCDSEPWLNIELAEQCRAQFDGWRRSHCLKDLDDWASWDDAYLFSRVRLKRDVPRNRGGNLNDIFKAMFIRAYVQELCGLARTLGNKQIAELLTSLGYETSVDDLKNAKRLRFYPNVVPSTPETVAFGQMLSEHFPTIDLSEFFDFE